MGRMALEMGLGLGMGMEMEMEMEMATEMATELGMIQGMCTRDVQFPPERTALECLTRSFDRCNDGVCVFCHHHHHHLKPPSMNR